MSEEIASTELVALRPTGERLFVRIAIRRPEHTDHDDWVCRVDLQPLVHGPTTGLHGADSFQALAIALSFVRQQLDYFLEDGGRLLVPRQQGDEDYPIDAMFGSLRRDAG